jgi:proprotein convertase subtilisin/kexin type 5
VLYFYYANQCLINCPNGRYGEGSNNTCVFCNPACLTCFGPSTIQCYSCRPDNTTGIYYYLSFGTTYCVDTCPYGQYAVNGSLYTCQPCSINCATCVGTSTHCLTCTFINTINIVYLHNAACIPVCPNLYWMNSSAPLDHQCSSCHSYCAVCTGPSNSECSKCANQTVNSTWVIYYKDLYSTTCNTTCPDGQFISVYVPNICVPCASKCLLCAINSTNCFKCAFTHYLFVPNNSCESQCPPNYYNDPVMTSNYYYCTKCTSGCLTCTGPSLSNCQTCQNATILGSPTNFFKDPTNSICNTTCRTGYFGNVLNNNCDPCQVGCVSCSSNATYCFACLSTGGNDYYKPKNSNSCVLVCPNG